MSLRHYLVAVLLAIGALPSSAGAALISYQGQGIYTPDPTVLPSFGLYSTSTFTFSFNVDTDEATLVPAGTIISSSGAYFPEQLLLYQGDAINDLSYTIGSTSWTSSDFIEQALGTSGFTYALLISGDPFGPSGFKLALDKLSSGFASAGQFTCGPQCSILPQGDTFDYLTGNPGVISAATLEATSAVPEPPPGR